MAINVTFNGATIYKPGAYSKEVIDLGGGFPVGPTGIVAIFGEAPSGPPGSKAGDITSNAYTPDQFPAIVSLYGNGDIADACSFLFAPGADGAIPGGAQQVFIYKTNESTQAALELSPDTYTFTTPTSVPVSATAGAVYTLNGQLFTVTSTVTSSNTVSMTSPSALTVDTGTLVLLTGTGSSSIPFISYSVVSYGTVVSQIWGTGGNQIIYTDIAVPASPATITSSAPFTLSSLSSSDAFTLRIQGAATALDNTFTATNAPYASIAAMNADLALSGNWSQGLPSNISFVASGTPSLAYLTITQGLGTNPQRNGYGMNFELVSGNMLPIVNIPSGLYTSLSEDMAVITVNNAGTLTTESGTVGGTIVFNVGRIGTSSSLNVAPVITINATDLLLINNSIVEYTIPLANYTSISSLVSFINGNTKGLWSAAAASTLTGQLSPSIMDEVTNLGANGASGILPAQIKNDANAVQTFFSQSAQVNLFGPYIETNPLSLPKATGLPDPQGPINLSGGVLGGTMSADIANALLAIQEVHVNSVIPLFSRDATQDILDGITDPSSTYTIDAIHQAVKTFLSLQATIKAKSECQGYLSLKDTYATCKLEASNMADSRIQLCIQDIRQVDASGNINWFLPWAGSCLLAGARGGSPVGLPMTFKYFNMSGIRQTGQLLSTPEAQIVIDFNPQTQHDDAIMNGITFWEKPLTGGFRLVVDNTTYGADDNWVYNRANVQYAADVLAYDFRSQLENIYVGAKNTVSAAEVKSTCDSILSSYLAQGITVSTSDAPQGYKQLVVQIVGNTINISVVVKLVEGIDFVLATITLQRASSSA